MDVGIAQKDMGVVLQTGWWMVGLSIIGAIVGIACTAVSVLASQGFGADLRDALFTKVQSLSFGNIDQLETGQLITRLTNDVSQLQELVSMLLRIMVRAPLLLIGSFVMAMLTSPTLAPMFIFLLPVIAANLFWVINKAYPMFGDVQGRLDQLNTVMQENLAGVRVVKAFVRGAHEIARFAKINAGLMRITVRATRTVAAAQPVMTVALYAGVVAAMWYGGIQVNAGSMKVGQIIAFTSYLTRTLWSLMFTSMLSMRIARAQASAERIQEVLESRPHVENRPEPRPLAAPLGRVAFENVTFAYGLDGGDPVLRDVSFVAEPGQTVAVLGATGSGKSSLIHLIPRFYDVTEGAVTLDGVDVREFDKVTLRRAIGVALQEAVLFTGTVRDNIRYGRPEASHEEVVAAAQVAQAHDFIMGFPDGYDTLVGQRGVNLSGGQKQRIAIARALLVQPAVLILDDSTSAVDVETESEIQDALDALMDQRCSAGRMPELEAALGADDGHSPSADVGRTFDENGEGCAPSPDAGRAPGADAGRLSTSFVIAQRISTVLKADKILVLDEGRVAAEGTHEELMGSSPIYREIYESQLGGGVGGNGGTGNGRG